MRAEWVAGAVGAIGRNDVETGRAWSAAGRAAEPTDGKSCSEQHGKPHGVQHSKLYSEH